MVPKFWKGMAVRRFMAKQGEGKGEKGEIYFTRTNNHFLSWQVAGNLTSN